MSRLCIFVGTIVGGYAAWALGRAFELGLAWTFVLGGAGSVAGVYAGWKLARHLE